MNVLMGVFAGHSVESPNTQQMVMVGGVRHDVWGHSTPILEGRVPKVVLLSEDSTPQDPKLHPDAERNFQAAAERLVQEGVEFYTVFRPTWALRAMRWTKEYR